MESDLRAAVARQEAEIEALREEREFYRGEFARRVSAFYALNACRLRLTRELADLRAASADGACVERVARALWRGRNPGKGRVEGGTSPTRAEDLGWPDLADDARSALDAAIAVQAPPGKADVTPVRLAYRNNRGEVSRHSLTPTGLRFGTLEGSPEPRWLLRAFDEVYGGELEYAMDGLNPDDGAEGPGEARCLEFKGRAALEGSVSDAMFLAYKGAVKGLVESVPEAERGGRWKKVKTGGYRVAEREKCAARYLAMRAASAPSKVTFGARDEVEGVLRPGPRTSLYGSMPAS